MAREDPQEQIKLAAEESGRSMNAEIVDALREFFPADPSLNEIAGALEHSISLLTVIKEGLAEKGTPPPGSVTKALAVVQAANDDLYKLMGKERISPVAMLTESAIEKVEEVRELYTFEPDHFESLVNNLLIMGAEEVLNRNSRLRIYIEEGDKQRVVEIRFPEEEPVDE